MATALGVPGNSAQHRSMPALTREIVQVGGADNVVQVVEGHRGYGDPPDIRRPAQEFYHLPAQNPMAVDGNDDLVRPFGARPTIKQRVRSL